MTGDGTVHQAPLLPVTTVGSLPKPAWLAEPEVLWSPWQLHGDVLPHVAGGPAPSPDKQALLDRIQRATPNFAPPGLEGKTGA